MAEHDDASHGQVSQPDRSEHVVSEDMCSEASDVELLDAEDYDGVVDVDTGEESKDVAAQGKTISPVRLATLVGVVAVTALTSMAGWLAYRGQQAHQVHEQNELLVQAGRQGALNLTTIDYHHADADVQRIVDSATGSFYEDFSKRSKPFAEVVKKAQSVSVGTVTEAGLESQAGDEAQVMVAVSVVTTIAGEPESEPRHWRMRISVKQLGNEAKVSNVAFVQ